MRIGVGGELVVSWCLGSSTKSLKLSQATRPNVHKRLRCPPVRADIRVATVWGSPPRLTHPPAYQDICQRQTAIAPLVPHPWIPSHVDVSG